MKSIIKYAINSNFKTEHSLSIVWFSYTLAQSDQHFIMTSDEEYIFYFVYFTFITSERAVSFCLVSRVIKVLSNQVINQLEFKSQSEDCHWTIIMET